MEVQEFIQNFADLFDDTDVSIFKLETKFRELDEWSPMKRLIFWKHWLWQVI